MKKMKHLISLFLVFAFIATPALLSAPAQPFTLPTARAEGETLTISGDGVAGELVFIRDELEKMSVEKHIYSVVNNFPTERVDYAAGVPLLALLELAGLKDTARTMTFTSTDGYSRTFTVKELLEPRYYFPAEGEKTAVPAMICLDVGSSGFEDLETTNLRLIMGQRAPGEQNNPWFVRFLSTIEVSTEEPEKWPAVTFHRTVGSDGVTLQLQHANLESVKIYYTTDGSAPTVESKMYNISASHFQPQLNQPLLISSTTVVRAIAIGAGRVDSAVSSITITLYNVVFNDLAGDEWDFAREAIEELAKMAIVNGVGNNRFNPGGNLSRAMFVTMLGRGLNLVSDELPVVERHFPDVNYDLWYGPHVEWAVDNGIIQGYPDGTFRPYTTLTVEHMLIMARNAGLAEEDIPDLGDLSKTATRAQAAVVAYALMHP